MEIKINLATASLKDAEHTIFIIGAYFGMTDLPHIANVGNPGMVAPAITLPPGSLAAPAVAATPPAGPSAAEVFGGNAAPGATVPAGPVAPATPAPSVPTAAVPVGTPAAPTLALVASVELDNEGLPWDARINALGDGGAHPKKADGTWRAKRGLNDGTLVARVKEELRQTLAAGRPPVAVVPPVPPVAPVAPAVPPVPPTVPPVAVLPPAAPAAPLAPVALPPPTTFEQLMPRITPVVMAGHLPNTALHEAATAYGLPNAMALTQRPDIVPSVWVYLQSICPQLQ